MEKLIVVAWAFWSNRNECRNSGGKKSCQALLQGALEYLDAYQACVVELGNLKQPTEPAKWKPPSLDQYKINVDGAVFKELCMQVWGS